MELDIGVHVTRQAGTTFTSAETDAVFLILGYIPGFAKDEISVSLNEARTKIIINGNKREAYLIETRVSERVRITNEVSTQGFSEDFLIPNGVDFDRIDVGFEEEETLLIITLPKVARQEQEIALEIGKEVPLDLQETDICEEKELEVDYENLEEELVEREIETTQEITESEVEVEITTDVEILEIDEVPNLDIEIKDDDLKPKTKINIDNPETKSDIKIEDPKPEYESKHEEPKTVSDILLEDPQPELEIKHEDPELQPENKQEEDQIPELEIIRESPKLEVEINFEVSDPEKEIEQDGPELELEMNEPGNTIIPQESEIETTAKEKEEETVEDAPKPENTETQMNATENEEKIVEDVPSEYPTQDQNMELPESIERSESEEDEQDQLSPPVTTPPSESSPKSTETNEPDHSEEQVQEEPCTASPPSIEENEDQNEEQVQEDQPIVYPTLESDPDSSKSIQRSESNSEEKNHLRSDQESEVSSTETEEGAGANEKERRRRRRGGAKSTLYPSMIAGSVFLLSLMAIFMHVLRNKRRAGTRR